VRCDDPLFSAVRRTYGFPIPTREQDTLGEVLALLQFAQFLTEKGALVLNCPKPGFGSLIGVLAAGEAPLDVTRQRKPEAAKDKDRCARETQLDDVNGIHQDS
jgi:hypothetical protein